MSSFTCTFDASRITGRLDKLAQTTADAARPAAQAGAQVYYDGMRDRVPESPPGTAHVFTSKRSKGGAVGQKYVYYAGDLKRAIYQKYADDKSGDGKALYVISYRKSGPGAVPYGHMVEHGTSKMAPKPFVRPTYDALNRRAVQAARTVINRAAREALA